MPRMIIYPYKMSSASARQLSRALDEGETDSIRVRSDGRYTPLNTDLVVNWGSSTIPIWMDGVVPSRLLNHPTHVQVACNKTTTLLKLLQEHISVVPFTVERSIALEWQQQGQTVFSRTLPNSHSGRGIIINRPTDEITPAPLYTLYKKKRSEFRVHVFKGRVLDVQEKRREAGFIRTDGQSLIRSHANGWVFCREHIILPDGLAQLAVRAIAALNLDFGAVDIIYNERENQLYVLEVNTAVGLQGVTLDKYKDAIKSYYLNLVT